MDGVDGSESARTSKTPILDQEGWKAPPWRPEGQNTAPQEADNPSRNMQKPP